MTRPKPGWTGSPSVAGPLTRRDLLIGATGTAAGLLVGAGGTGLAHGVRPETVMPTAAPEHFGPAWMVLATEREGAKARAKRAGATHGHVRAFWDQLQNAAGGEVDAEPVLREVEAVRAAGLKVCLEVCLQYPPPFVTDHLPKLKDQYGTQWSPTQESGDNIRDWIWSAPGRGYVTDFLDQLFGRLDWSKIERVKTGGLTKGELQYPSSHNRPQFWAYSAAAQGKQELAPQMSPCPVPGHVPTPANRQTGGAAGWTDRDEAFATWYVQSLINWMTWLVSRFREHFSGPVYMMHPGAGIRPVSQTPTSPRQAYNYQVNLGSGLDWDATIAAYPDEGVRPYTTWIDSDHFRAQAGYSLVHDGNGAPWWALLVAARKHGRSGRLWGENTGGQSLADLDRVVRHQALAHGYEGLAWLDDRTLTSGKGVTYADLRAAISRTR
ncbi:hypothetical protein LWF15_22405 [Kineosporia rhizophila]|uniref:hypothetical protein n=1 Tax=Kineosporia TaxID=49184 RepID=UPI001E38EB70|nr:MULTISPECIES: hypothetical protein [Kineosporia]MCE0538254.1 hypothetical protein [Kineosporia rhizophila]GLY18690.1 hypothetical protein Kisp01_57040 [Kineosporia sp. NBRC 101677]